MYNHNGLFAMWYKEALDALLYIISFSACFFIIYLIKLTTNHKKIKEEGMDVENIFKYASY